MIKLIKKINFSPSKNRMKHISNVREAIKIFESKNSNNLKFLLKERFDWMNNFINESDIGIEVGSGAGFAKSFIKNKNFKISDLSEESFLDYKKVDAQSTYFEDNSFDYIIASNMVHHIPYPMKFFREMNRILKKNGRLIIFEPYCSIVCQLITIMMRHEGFDFTIDVWDEKKPKSSVTDAWHGNIAVPNLIFDNKKLFEKKLGNFFYLEYEKFTECLIFLNSGGVTSKTFCIPLPTFALKLISLIDIFLVKLFPDLFCMGRRLVLKKVN